VAGIAQVGLEAILKMAGFNKGLKEYQKGVTGMEKQTKTASSGLKEFDKSFGKLGGGFTSLIPGAIGVTGAIMALGKAFEFGKQGAVIGQTKESFDRLMDSMGIAPDILQQMRDATLGTVDDMTLMSSTMTLVAGTSDELGSAMVEAAPQLLRIAKAANKLNPTLGDTASLYQSLATGIKRASPLILDNLGLTIKVGTANEAMAAKMGKSVEALTAEEKQMALLEAALEAGDRMIEQVGGSVESMSDQFARAEVEIKNTTDTVCPGGRRCPVWYQQVHVRDGAGIHVAGRGVGRRYPHRRLFPGGHGSQPHLHGRRRGGSGRVRPPDHQAGWRAKAGAVRPID
jgi:hypothetical protein